MYRVKAQVEVARAPTKEVLISWSPGFDAVSAYWLADSTDAAVDDPSEAITHRLRRSILGEKLLFVDAGDETLRFWDPTTRRKAMTLGFVLLSLLFGGDAVFRILEPNRSGIELSTYQSLSIGLAALAVAALIFGKARLPLILGLMLVWGGLIVWSAGLELGFPVALFIFQLWLSLRKTEALQESESETILAEQLLVVPGAFQL